MDKQQLEKDRLFAENIDRLLAGEAIETGPETGADVSAALDFAKQMIEITPEPDARFENLLQAKLLTELANAEKPVKTGWWRQPIWQTVTATVFVMVIGLIVWLSGVFNPAVTVPAALAANAATDKAVYAAGELVNIEVTLTNTTDKPLTLKEFPPIVSLMDSDTRQPVYTHYAATTVSRTLSPGETAAFTMKWNQYGTTGQRVAGGTYYIELEDMDSQGQPLQLKLERPAEFEILPAGSTYGDIYKTIEIGQSQTAGDITITLKQLHLTETGAFLDAFMEPPPGYNYKAANDYAAFATYYIDNGWIKYGGRSSFACNPDGIDLVWYFTEPVPPETQEILLIIANAGELEGPWEFRITMGEQ